MIIRTWRAVAPSEQIVKDYAAHLERSTFKEMAELSGFVSASLSQKLLVEGKYELLVSSVWQDMASVKQFAKGKIDDAVVKPQTQKVLSSFDEKVEYFEVLASSGVLR